MIKGKNQYAVHTEFVNRPLLLSKYLTCERLLSQWLKNLEKNERSQYLIQMFTLSLFQDKCTKIYKVFLLCLFELLVVKNEVILEIKTAHGKKIKASELFFLPTLKSSKKHVIFLHFVNIHIISPTKLTFVINLGLRQSSTTRKTICQLFTPLQYIYFSKTVYGSCTIYFLK